MKCMEMEMKVKKRHRRLPMEQPNVNIHHLHLCEHYLFALYDCFLVPKMSKPAPHPDRRCGVASLNQDNMFSQELREASSLLLARQDTDDACPSHHLSSSTVP